MTVTGAALLGAKTHTVSDYSKTTKKTKQTKKLKLKKNCQHKFILTKIIVCF